MHIFCVLWTFKCNEKIKRTHTVAQVEFSSPVLGGRCVKVGDRVLLRHFSTQHYLSLRRDGSAEMINSFDLSHQAKSKLSSRQQQQFTVRTSSKEKEVDSGDGDGGDDNAEDDENGPRRVRERCFFVVHARSSSHNNTSFAEGWVKLNDLLLLQHVDTGRWLR
jgi:hypothetical protein